jgi:hypothetical protein
MFLEGIIGDVAIYNRALTEKEIRTDMEEGVYHLLYNLLKNCQPRGVA